MTGHHNTEYSSHSLDDDVDKIWVCLICTLLHNVPPLNKSYKSFLWLGTPHEDAVVHHTNCTFCCSVMSCQSHNFSSVKQNLGWNVAGVHVVVDADVI